MTKQVTKMAPQTQHMSRKPRCSSESKSTAITMAASKKHADHHDNGQEHADHDDNGPESGFYRSEDLNSEDENERGQVVDDDELQAASTTASSEEEKKEGEEDIGMEDLLESLGLPRRYVLTSLCQPCIAGPPKASCPTPGTCCKVLLMDVVDVPALPPQTSAEGRSSCL